MMGKRQTTGTLFDVGNVFDLALDPDGFYAQLATAAPRLFSNDRFKRLYHERRGRYSVPPSLLALLLLLQAHDGCSDAETLARTAYDLRWCVVLGKPAGEPLCAKSTLQEFRAKLVMECPECLLKASIVSGCLKPVRRPHKPAGLLGIRFWETPSLSPAAHVAPSPSLSADQAVLGHATMQRWNALPR